MNEQSATDFPEGCHLAYTVSHEAWYAQAAGRGDPPTIMVAAAHEGGGVAWEFAVEEHNLGGKTIRVCVFADAHDAFLQIPEFFRELAFLDVCELDGVRLVLDGMGAVDETVREMPERYRDAEMPLRERIVAALPWDSNRERIASVVVALLDREES